MGKERQDDVRCVLNTTTHAIEIMQQQGKHARNLIALYIMYQHTGAWQGALHDKPSNMPMATNAYMAMALCVSANTIKKYRSKLIQLGLIESVRKKVKGGVRDYVRVFLYPEGGGPKNVLPPEAKKRPTNTIVKHNNTKTPTPAAGGFGAKVKRTRHQKAATYLHDHLTKERLLAKNKNYSKWPDQFRLLETRDGFNWQEIGKVLKWYTKHIRDEYMFKAYSAKSFREKYPKILDKYLTEHKKTKAAKPGKPNKCCQAVLENLKSFQLPATAKANLPAIVTASYVNLSMLRVKLATADVITKKMYDDEMAKGKGIRSSHTSPYRFNQELQRSMALQPLMTSYFTTAIQNLLNWSDWHGDVKHLTMTEGTELAVWIGRRMGYAVSWPAIEKHLEKFGG